MIAEGEVDEKLANKAETQEKEAQKTIDLCLY
jgi:hypothetical protein